MTQDCRSQSLGAGDCGAVEELTGRVDVDAAIANTPLAGGVEVLERQAERIDDAVARRSLRAAAVLLHAFANR